MSNELDKADSTMGRIQKYINFFNRHYMGDKIFLGCICCVLVIIVIIFIMSFVLKSGIKSTIDKI